jgi:Family of unknown function (DUF6152)
MMLSRLRTVQIVLGGLLLACAGAQEPDPYGADFDPGQPVRLTGQVIELQMTNPRAWIIVSVNAGSAVEPDAYAVMLPSIASLMRRGWTRDSFVAGDSITIEGDLAADGALRARARRVINDEGATLLDLDAQPMVYAADGARLASGLRLALPADEQADRQAPQPQ